MEERISREATPQEAAQLWTATYVLMGLRYPAVLTDRLLEGVRAMEDSVTYQAIIAKGEVTGMGKEARSILIRLGSKRFGPPDDATQTSIQAITALDQLEALAERVYDASSWSDLLPAAS